MFLLIFGGPLIIDNMMIVLIISMMFFMPLMVREINLTDKRLKENERKFLETLDELATREAPPTTQEIKDILRSRMMFEHILDHAIPAIKRVED